VCLLLQDLIQSCARGCAQSRGPTKSTVATFPRTRECRAREVLLRWQRGPRGPRATGEPVGCALHTYSVRVSCVDPVRVLRALAPPARCRRPRCARRSRAPRRFATRPSRGASSDAALLTAHDGETLARGAPATGPAARLRSALRTLAAAAAAAASGDTTPTMPPA
jgi:hypothetical protein